MSVYSRQESLKEGRAFESGESRKEAESAAQKEAEGKGREDPICAKACDSAHRHDSGGRAEEVQIGESVEVSHRQSDQRFGSLCLE
jgi:hypothetical protein